MKLFRQQRIAVGLRFGGRLPHEMRLPLTYFQTLVDFLSEETATQPRNGDDDENEDVVSVDVDALIRKGQTSGFGVSE